MDVKKKSLEVPQNDARDIAHIAAGVAISAATTIVTAATGLPFLGANELFKLLVTPSLEQRRDRWMEQIAQMVYELQQMQLSVEDLAGNDEFQTLLSQASQAAIRTHSEEKRVLLKNALVSTFEEGASFDISSLYLSTLERLQPVHMVILKLTKQVRVEQLKVYDPTHVAFVEYLLKKITPKIERTVLAILASELHQLGLVGIMRLILPGDNRPMQYYTLTAFGMDLLAFLKVD